jgi:threonine/homoserine/homoserine lactone efflux protein
MFTGIDHIGLFIAAGILLNLTPGPDVLYIVTHAARSGWRAASIAHATGTPPHPSTGTAPTENAILLSSTTPIDTTARAGNSLKNVFIRGFGTNVLNPKVALFFLAFLPQFIAPGAPHPTLSFLILGVIFNINSLWVGLGYAWIGSAASRRWVSLQSHLRTLERTAGAIFIGFGLKLALMDNPPI